MTVSTKHIRSAKTHQLMTMRKCALLVCLTCALMPVLSGQTTDDVTSSASSLTSTDNVSLTSYPSTADPMMNTTDGISMSSPKETTSIPLGSATDGSTSMSSNSDSATTTTLTTEPKSSISSGLGPGLTTQSTIPSASPSPTEQTTTPPPPPTTTTTMTTTTIAEEPTTKTPETTTTTMKTTTMTKGATAKVVVSTVVRETKFGTIGLPLFLITLAALICVILALAIFYFYGKRKSGSHYIQENGGAGGNVRGPQMALQMEDVNYGNNFETIDLEDERKSKADNGSNPGLLSFKNHLTENDTASNDDVNSVTVEPPSWLRVEPTNNEDTASNFSTQAQTDEKDTTQEVDENLDDNELTNGDNREGSDLLSVNSSALDEEELPPPPLPSESDDQVEANTEM